MESALPPLRYFTHIATVATCSKDSTNKRSKYFTGRTKTSQRRMTVHTFQTPKIVSLQAFRGILPSLFSLFIKNTRSDIHPDKSFRPIISNQEERTQLTEGQEQFLAVIVDPKNTRNIDEDTIKRFLQYFDPFLRRVIHQLPHSVVCSSKKNTIPLTNFEYLRFLYSVLTVIVEISPSQILMQHFTKERMNAIINLLQTSDVREKEMVENIICILISKGFGISIPLTAIILRRLTEYANGSINYLCVNSCLRILSYILKKDTSYDKRILTMRYQQDLIPLFLTDEIPSFIVLLIPIIQECYEFDLNNCIITLRYLIKHWPYTNHEKAVIYMHRIPTIIARVSVESVKEFVPRLSELVYSALTSGFYSLVAEAINFLADEKSAGLIGQHLLSAHPDTLDRLRELVDFWEFSVRKQAAEAIPGVLNNLSAFKVPKKAKAVDSKSFWTKLSNAHKIPLVGDICY